MQYEGVLTFVDVERKQYQGKKGTREFFEVVCKDSQNNPFRITSWGDGRDLEVLRGRAGEQFRFTGEVRAKSWRNAVGTDVIFYSFTIRTITPVAISPGSVGGVLQGQQNPTPPIPQPVSYPAPARKGAW